MKFFIVAETDASETMLLYWNEAGFDTLDDCPAMPFETPEAAMAVIDNEILKPSPLRPGLPNVIGVKNVRVTRGAP